MKLSVITKSQWISVVRNALFAFVASFGALLATPDHINKQLLISAAAAGFMAALKIIEKALTAA